MILLCESVKNILMAKVSPARPPYKTFRTGAHKEYLSIAHTWSHTYI
jgi:hypothetical protein